MAHTCTLSEAVSNLIHDGDVVAMEGLGSSSTFIDRVLGQQATKQAGSAHA